MNGSGKYWDSPSRSLCPDCVSFMNEMLGESSDKFAATDALQSVVRFAGFAATDVQPASMAASAPPIPADTASYAIMFMPFVANAGVTPITAARPVRRKELESFIGTSAR